MELNDVMTEKEAADYLRVSLGFLRVRRTRNENPPYCKLGGSVRYRLEDLKEFVNAGLVETRDEHE